MKKRRIKIIKLGTVDSTNTYLKGLAESGEGEECCVIADCQTSGRGRRGKSFYSPNETGLYMSILVTPDLKVEESLFVTSMTAVALCRAIEKVSDKKCQIKWVNDIYIYGKKAAGILAEGSFDYENNLTNYIIVGIGVNLEAPKNGFPDDIKSIATALEKKGIKEKLTEAILEEFFALYDKLPSIEYLKEYKSRSCIIGREIEVLGEESYTCRVLDIDEKCRLVVECENKETKTLSSGEISTKIIY